MKHAQGSKNLTMCGMPFEGPRGLDNPQPAVALMQVEATCERCLWEVMSAAAGQLRQLAREKLEADAVRLRLLLSNAVLALDEHAPFTGGVWLERVHREMLRNGPTLTRDVGLATSGEFTAWLTEMQRQERVRVVAGPQTDGYDSALHIGQWQNVLVVNSIRCEEVGAPLNMDLAVAASARNPEWLGYLTSEAICDMVRTVYGWRPSPLLWSCVQQALCAARLKERT